MQTLLQNLRFALRQLRRSPGFTLTVVLTLALGIGANAAVFSLFDQVLLRMLPVEKPKQLARFVWTGAFSGNMWAFDGDTSNFFSYPMYKDLSRRTQVFSGVLAADEASAGISWQNQAESRNTELVSGNYFQVLGLRPALGRLLTPQDDTAPGANPVAVLSYNYWKTRFAASPAVLGQTVRINGHPFTVLGVAPQNFRSVFGGYAPGLFLPLSMSDVVMPFMEPKHNFTNRLSLWVTVVARLRPGVTPQQAQAALDPLWHALRAQEVTLYPTATAAFRHRFLDLSGIQVMSDATGFSPGRATLEKPLILLMSMAGLLVAMCAINVATLLLLRAAARAREMSMRYALGAGRGRIAAQLLLEGGLLGAAGAAAGIALAPLLTQLLVRLMIQSEPGSQPYSTALDSRMLLFALGIGIGASLLFSIAPVLHFLRPDLALALRQNSGTSSKGSHRFRKFAVGAQILFSVVLLSGAGLFVRTLDNLSRQPVGFRTDHLLTFSLDPTASGYSEHRTPAIVASALDTVRQIPGVVSASANDDGELADFSDLNGFGVQGYRPVEGEHMDFEAPWIEPGYFATLGQPLLLGRDFTSADTKGHAKVAIVNLAFAKRFYGSAQSALGRLLDPTKDPAKPNFDTTIVGVVGDIKHYDLRTDIGPAVYMPYLQKDHPGGLHLYIRTAQAPETVEAAVRQSIHRLDPTLVAESLHTMQDQIAVTDSYERALAILATGFSALAMLLAAVGLYGVLAYSTEQRTREIGIRMALGEQRSSIVLVVVREMLLIAAVATAIALPSVVALATLFRSQLYGVTAADPLTLAVAALLTTATVLLAAAIPARRAAGIHPIEALRTE